MATMGNGVFFWFTGGLGQHATRAEISSIIVFVGYSFFFFGIATAVLRDLRASLFSFELANEVGLLSPCPLANYSGFSNFCAGHFSVIGLNYSGWLHQGI